MYSEPSLRDELAISSVRRAFGYDSACQFPKQIMRSLQCLVHFPRSHIQRVGFTSRPDQMLSR
jgi:hypothetical protein